MSDKIVFPGKIESLLISFIRDSSGELMSVVGRRISGDTIPVKLINGDRVKEIYKELTGNDLKL